MSVDAGFVCWEEYLSVFRLLLRDPDADLRTRHLQAVVWFFIYRYGARVSEALGLRRKDIVNPDGEPIVLFRNNDYREIKSDAGIRQVPLIGPLLAEEREALLAWMDHIGEFADDDSLAAIFADASQPRELIDRRAICDRITEALRAVTGSPRARLHYGRHSFGTRCEWLMTLDRLPRNAEISRVIRRIIGPADPREARALLLDTSEPSKRGPWAVSLAIGHAWPGTTFRYYTHTSDLLAACYLDGVFKQAAIALDAPTAAYASGVAVSDTERLFARSGERTCLSEDIARLLGQGKFIHVATLCSRRESAPILPRKPKTAPPRLTPELTDRALDLVHRRRRVDGLEQTLFLPGPLIRRLLTAEFTVRNERAMTLPVPAGRQPRSARRSRMRAPGAERPPKRRVFASCFENSIKASNTMASSTNSARPSAGYGRLAIARPPPNSLFPTRQNSPRSFAGAKSSACRTSASRSECPKIISNPPNCCGSPKNTGSRPRRYGARAACGWRRIAFVASPASGSASSSAKTPSARSPA